MFESIKNRFSQLPDKKKWIDVITATLTIPVLLTVTIANLNKIKSKDAETTQETSPTQAPIIVRDFISVFKEQTNDTNKELTPTLNEENKKQPTNTPEPTQQVSVTPSCKMEPQPYEITYPKENEKVEVDPVCVVLNAKDQGYCTTQWAYRVNNSTWSNYTSDPICLYNMASGNIKLEVRTKNQISGQEKTITRNFSYQKEDTQVTSPTPSTSLTPGPTP